MAKKVSASEKLKAMKEDQIKRKIQISAIVGLIVYLLGILPNYFPSFPSDIRIQISLWVTGLGLLLFALVRPVWLWNRIKRLSTLRSLDFVAKRK